MTVLLRFIFNGASATAKSYLGTQTMCLSRSVLAILVHVGAAMQSAKGLAAVDIDRRVW